MREEQPRQMSFEIVGIDLNERSKLRRILNGGPSSGEGFIDYISNLGQVRVAFLSGK